MPVTPVGSGRAAGAPPIERLVRPFREFVHLEAAGGVVLLAAAALALVWANSPWAWAYAALWHTPVTVGAGGAVLTQDLHHWINDGLMVLFFFVVGLEIKREVLVGELASPRRAALPAAAALGGMLLPALLFSLLNAGGPGAAGWGVPMATDIAFALGILALLGRRVPLALKVFLTALAVLDDLGAVLVIALFYTPDVVWPALAAAGLVLALLVAANRLGVRTPLVYGGLGVGLWLAVLASGVHATVAGVLLAMTIPASTRIDPAGFLARGRAYLADFASAGQDDGAGVDGRAGPRPGFITEGQQTAVQALEAACEHVQTPLHRLEHALHPWVAFAVMPLFALANAGVALPRDPLATVADPVTLGVLAGLVVGKPLGITAAALLATRTGLAVLPDGVTWRQVTGAAVLGGIGFTMSLFIAALAFADAALLDAAKLGILGASLVAGLGGWLLLRTAPAPAAPPGPFRAPGAAGSPS
ncbi:MAG TPA: Na+/H+ antiporter NhaA [Chloroflexota bacterium]|nr:Na+/H+ antiporter NhaA [Chloroflexota bacterium]